MIDRASLENLASFGDARRQPGQSFAAHSIATDSRSEVLTTKMYEGKRVQTCAHHGSEPVSNENENENENAFWTLRR